MQDTIEPRMTHVVSLVPEAGRALYALANSAKGAGLPATTVYLVHLRASRMSASGPSRHGARRRTSPTPSAPRSRWPRWSRA